MVEVTGYKTIVRKGKKIESPIYKNLGPSKDPTVFTRIFNKKVEITISSMDMLRAF